MRRAFQQHKPLGRGDAIKAIHALARDLKLDEDTRKEMQQKLTGVESCKDMNVTQLRTVAARLSLLANDAGLGRQGRFEAALKREKKAKRPGRDERLPEEPPTKEQMEKIRDLAEHVGYVGVAYMQLCRRCTRRPDLRDGHAFPQTRAEANKVMEALKAMHARGYHAPHGGTPA